MADNIGSPTGSGNPPGQYSDSYLKEVSSEDNFLNKSDYRNFGGLNQPSVSDVGNQPKEDKNWDLESRSNKTNPIPA